MEHQELKTWFITGCSTGFGRELAKAVLARGYRAVVTARDPKQVEEITAGHEGRSLTLRLDVTDATQVTESVRRAEDHFGHIDVLAQTQHPCHQPQSSELETVRLGRRGEM